jgi:DNA-binding CsgD family transcriptional regulator
MVRLSHSALRRLHRALLEIHAQRDFKNLAQTAPLALGRVIASDRTAFNDLTPGRVLPHPIPSYWAKLGPVFLAHYHEQPVSHARLHRPVALGDHAHNPKWTMSTLWNEYYLPIGIRDLLCVRFQARGMQFGFNFNRSERQPFSPEDRIAVELLSRHLAVACSGLLASPPVNDPITRLNAFPSRTRITLDRQGRMLGPLAPDVRALLREFFLTDGGEGRSAPEEILRWLASVRTQLADADSAPQLPRPLTRRRGASVVEVRLGRHDAAGSELIMEKHSAAPDVGLTTREAEILHWLREGKRNREIALILGLSPRTVGKHLENIFLKLGVETRTAAASAAARLDLNHHA